MIRIGIVAFVFVVGMLASGCATHLESMGAGLAYRSASLPREQIRLNLPYRTDPAAHSKKHRLDLFLPDPSLNGWPTMIFVHGGGWTDGDRATNILGVDPMRNIGRFYASRGTGVAVLSYRLQPEVTWREQVDDVATATAWVRTEVERLGGDPNALFLAGHSAGAWLASWVGLNDTALSQLAMTRASLCGLVLVSGAGYDLADEETYRLGASREYFEDLFGRGDPDWARTASIYYQIDSPVPATFVLSAEGEPAKIRHQGDRLFMAIRDRSSLAQRLVVPGQNHQRILVSMSRADDLIAQGILRFMAETQCPVGR